jgi:putative nucleotidyltransferase with HDIG domain
MSRVPYALGLLGLSLVPATAIGLAWRLDAQRRHRRASRLHRVMVQALLNALSAGDPVTARHSRRVADLTDALAATFPMSRRERATLRVAALLHDMGKIEDDIFHVVHQPHKLNEEDRGKIRKHPHESAHILRPLERLHPGLARIVESHHECWAGGGYPSGAAGEEIPLGARIISVADVFDAMTQARAYRPALEPEAALAEIRQGAGSRFDPDVVRRLEGPAVLKRWREIRDMGQRITMPRRSQRTAVSARGNGRSTKGSIE